MLCLSRLTENGLLVDTQYACLKNPISGLVVPCSVRWTASVTVLDLYLEPREDGEILLIVDASERYSGYATCFSPQQAAKLPKQKPWDYEIPPRDPQAKIHKVTVYETTWEEDEALQKYLDENLPTGTVRRLCSATGALILFAHKMDASLRPVIDYRAHNSLSIPNKYPLPLIR